MFPSRFWPDRFFAPRYWPKVGEDAGFTGHEVGARLYPPSFATSPEGDIYVAFGDRNIARWDGLLDDFGDAGVPAPGTACVVASSGSGTIVGSISAYVRFLDRDGRVSNLSPVSNVLDIAVTSGTIIGATNAGPIVIESTAHGLTTGQSAKVDGVIGNWGANGLWTVTVTDTNHFSLDGSIGTGTYVAGGTWSKGAAQINYTSVPTTTDPRVVRKQILRSKDGDTSVYYIDVDTTDLADTTLSSTNDDNDLVDAVSLFDTSGRDLNIVSHAEPPNWKRFLCHFRGRFWLAGQLEYKEGGIAVTNGSPTVTGLQTNWTSAMAGWRLFPLGENNTISYTVSSVDVNNQTLTLSTNYVGDTDPFMNYGLTPPVLNSNGGAEARSIYFSAAGLVESFNRLRSLTLEESNQGAITGLIPYQSNLYVACERALYRIIYQVRPETDAVVRGIVRRGLINNNCWKIMDNVVFAMDRRGCYVFTEAGVEEISQNIDGMFDGESATVINWRRSEFFHAADFPEESVIKWFVVLSGGLYPRHAICYCVRNKRWWIEEYSEPVTASTVAFIKGQQTPLLGLPSRRIGAACKQSVDGIPDGTTSTLRGTATSAGLKSLVDSAAAFTDDVVGLSVRIVEGTGIGQSRLIVGRTATTLTVKDEWLILPSTDSIYQIGGVSWTWRSGVFRWVPADNNQRRTMEVVWQPTVNTHQMSMKRFVNLSALPADYAFDMDHNALRTVANTSDAFVTTTDEFGHARQELSDTKPERIHGRETVRLQLEGTTNNESLTVFGVMTEGAVQ